ncbi:MAG: hypothetical protein NT169_20100 [Chloroflexi bacterium]|nr:hypothetical protein [Chloroflexota bacterium]
MLQQRLIFLIRDRSEVKVIRADFSSRDDSHLIPSEKHLVEQYGNIISLLPLHARVAFMGRECEFILGSSLNDEAIHAKGRGFVTTQRDEDVVRVLKTREKNFVYVVSIITGGGVYTRTPR